MDSQQRVYQKIIGSGTYHSARSIDDIDTKNIESISYENLYFSIEEFDEINTPENLFNALPESIKVKFNITGTDRQMTVNILNQIIERYDLIESVADMQEIDLTNDELSDVKKFIRNISSQEMIIINRLFLSDNFPSVCPDVQKTPDDIAFILPLFSCLLGERDIDTRNTTDMDRAVSTYSEYSSKRDAIEKKFSQMTNVFRFDIPTSTIPYSFSINGYNFSVTKAFKAGVGGKVDNNWGSSIRLTTSAALLCQYDMTNINISKSFLKKSLLPSGPKELWKIKKEIPPIGALILDLEAALVFDVILEIKGDVNFTSELFAGYTGIIGGSVTVGADYGVKWKKVLFVKLPVGIYINPTASGTYVMDHVYYFGPYSQNINPVALSSSSIYASVTPIISFGPALVAWKILKGEISAEAGLTGKFTVSMLSNHQELIKKGRLPFKGEGRLDGTLGVFGKGTVGYDFGTI